MRGRAKRWAGRFTKATARAVEEFTASLPFDWRLLRYDVLGSIAHARMLAQLGVLTESEAQAIIAGLREAEAELAAAPKDFPHELEDIHTLVEARLEEKIGPLAGKLHTARSRNDQVALDMRLYVRDKTCQTVAGLVGLQETLLGLAQRYREAILPGYTHLQRAQPVLLAHHLMAYFEMFQRDVERLQDAFRRADVCPLGSGAVAGVPYALDREAVARELGFASVTRNSIDAVSDRDFVIEFLSAASLGMAHLSRMAEEVVLWSSAEFGFLGLDDAYATGSSIMPQKKNPDVAELVRAKTGRVYGHLFALLTVLKGLPLAYNRDLQEDKEGLFDAADTWLNCLEVTSELLATASFRADRMRQAAEGDYATATDLADYLVRKGVPFRQAHRNVGELVAWCTDQNKAFSDLDLEEYRRFSPQFDEDVRAITAETAVASRAVLGGTAPSRVG
ncbi:MAG: argininosuccinate lyase, partial [Chloroflexi bacterium]|nr:argininosuccinate lyase [Chloroflexota bacterium]